MQGCSLAAKGHGVIAPSRCGVWSAPLLQDSDRASRQNDSVGQLEHKGRGVAAEKGSGEDSDGEGAVGDDVTDAKAPQDDCDIEEALQADADNDVEDTSGDDDDDSAQDNDNGATHGLGRSGARQGGDRAGSGAEEGSDNEASNDEGEDAAGIGHDRGDAAAHKEHSEQAQTKSGAASLRGNENEDAANGLPAAFAQVHACGSWIAPAALSVCASSANAAPQMATAG